MRTRRATVALLAVTAACFFPTVLTFVQTKQGVLSTYDYVVFAAVVWYVWRERATIVVRDRVWRQALGLMGVLSLAWLAGTVAHVEVVAQTAAPVILLLWAATVSGRRAAIRLLPILAIFLIAVPFLGTVRSVLQAMTVVVSGRAAAMVGVPAVIEEQTIRTTYGSFLVADYCAGTGYLLVGLIVGALHTQRYDRTAVGTWVTLGLAAFFPIVGNWIRVAGLILIGHASRMESVFITSPVPHAFFGWGIFVAALALFFLSAARVERLEAQRASLSTSPAEGSGSIGSPATLRVPALATVVAVIGPATYFLVGSLPSRPAEQVELPGRDLVWMEAGTAERPYAWTPAFQGSQRHLFSVWDSGSGLVLADRLIYLEQSPGRELLGGGNRIAPRQATVVQRMAGPFGPRRYLVNEAIVRSGEGHLLVWYWYRVGGADTALRARATLLELWGFATRRTTAELVSLSSACGPEDCAEAARALAAFLDGT